MAGKGGYTAAFQNIYSVPSPAPPEEHNVSIESLHVIAQCLQYQRHKVDGIVQANEFLTSTKTDVMVQLAQLTSAMGDMQAKIKTLSSTTTKPKMRYYCWICDSNPKHGSRQLPTKRFGHREKSYHRNSMEGGEKFCECQSGAIIDKPKIILFQISITYNIKTPKNSPFNKNLAISDYGANIHFTNRETLTMAPIKCSRTS